MGRHALARITLISWERGARAIQAAVTWQRAGSRFWKPNMNWDAWRSRSSSRSRPAGVSGAGCQTADQTASRKYRKKGPPPLPASALVLASDMGTGGDILHGCMSLQNTEKQPGAWCAEYVSRRHKPKRNGEKSLSVSLLSKARSAGQSPIGGPAGKRSRCAAPGHPAWLFTPRRALQK